MPAPCDAERMINEVADSFRNIGVITSAPLTVERVRLWSENNWDHMFAQEFGAFCGAFFAPRLAFTSRRPTVICVGRSSVIGTGLRSGSRALGIVISSFFAKPSGSYNPPQQLQKGSNAPACPHQTEMMFQSQPASSIGPVIRPKATEPMQPSQPNQAELPESRTADAKSKAANFRAVETKLEPWTTSFQNGRRRLPVCCSLRWVCLDYAAISAR
jgi:hypothetical protein